MKKLEQLYNRVATWLCAIGSDKYVHFIVGAILAALMAITVKPCVGREWASALGLFAAFVAGLIKEAWDDEREDDFDILDLATTSLGGIFGAMLFML